MLMSRGFIFKMLKTTIYSTICLAVTFVKFSQTAYFVTLLLFKGLCLLKLAS